MHASGLRAVEQAKTTGMWNALDHVDDLVVPDDLAAALDKLPPAAEHFATLPPSVRRHTLRWIASAKTPPTRANRISLTVEDAAHGRRVASNG